MTENGDTIAAEATPPGRGSLRVVRVSGREARSALRCLFRPQRASPWDHPRSLCLGDVVVQEENHLDRALAALFPGPDSLTGEDVFELQLHGSPGVVRGVLDALQDLGVRPALPGEFSYRAVLNGKMSVMDAEALNALVGAETPGQAIRIGGDSVEGAEAGLAQIRDGLLDLRACWEARVDFPEDVEESIGPEDLGRLGGLASRLRTFMDGARGARLLREGWRVALVGPVNSGKSSLFNALLRRERALVTPHPGTTRDVLEETLQVGGYPLILLDAAGIRNTRDPVEALGVGMALSAARGADATLFVYDASRGWDEEEEAVLRALQGPPLVILANKEDIAGGRRPVEGALGVSARTGEGLEGVVARLTAWMEETAPRKGEAVLVSERQIAAVAAAWTGCNRAREVLLAGFTEEVALQGIREAQTALEELFTGGSPEDLYDRIFASFCIGK
jgi:tRNA modification GTPase